MILRRLIHLLIPVLMLHAGEAESVPPHGLCVVLPAVSAGELVERTAGGRVLVHGLALDPATAERLRGEVAAAGANGLVTIQVWEDRPALPHAEEMVNDLRIDADALGADAPPAAEIDRVLIPRHGQARIRRKGEWTSHRTPMPASHGEWTHWFHDAGNNPVSRDQAAGPATGLRWIAEAQAGAGDVRVVGSGQLIAPAHEDNRRAAARVVLRARDAFNGLPVWQVVQGDMKLHRLPRCEPMIIDGERLIHLRTRKGPLIARSLRDGRELMTFDLAPLSDNETSARVAASTSDRVNQMAILFGRTLVVVSGNQAAALDADSGAVKWRWETAAGRYLALPSHDATSGTLAICEGDVGAASGRMSAFRAQVLHGLDPADGTVRWRTSIDLPDYVSNCPAHDGAFYLHTSPGLGNSKLSLLSVDARSGRIRWSHRELTMPGVGTMLVYPDRLFMVTSQLHAFAVADGTRLGSYSLGNSRCDVPRGNGRTIANFGHFLDVTAADAVQWERREIARNSCGGTTIPAYGMRYASGNRCACFEAVRGLVAMGHRPLPPATADGRRLQRGPAAGRRLGSDNTGWTAFLGDQRRSGSGGAISRDVPQQRWRTPVATATAGGPLADEWRCGDAWNGPITAPTVADGLVLVAETIGRRLVCLDARDGTVRWSFPSEGRIDAPPTIVRGRAVFGCHDGYVYCVDIADGSLAWRFQAAPSRRLITAHGQLASVWPVHGAVPVVGDMVLAAAGRHPEADGGIALWGLDLATGGVRWRRMLTNERPRLTLRLDGTAERIDNSAIFAPNRVYNAVLVADREVFQIGGVRLRVADGKDADEAHPQFALMPRWNSVSSPVLRAGQLNLAGPGGWNAQWGLLDSGALRRWRGDEAGRKPGIAGRPICVAPERIVVMAYATNSGAPGPLFCHTRAAVADGSRHLWEVDSLPGAKGRTVAASAMVVAGERIVITGGGYGAGDVVPSFAPLEVRSLADGRLLHQEDLPSATVDNGLAVAGGRLFISLEDGTVRCME